MATGIPCEVKSTVCSFVDQADCNSGPFCDLFYILSAADGGGGVLGVRTPPLPLFDQAFLCKFLVLYIFLNGFSSFCKVLTLDPLSKYSQDLHLFCGPFCTF